MRSFTLSNYSFQSISALLVVNLLDVDTAVIEETAPVLLDISSNNVLTYVQIFSRNVNLYGILAVGPTCVLLQQVTVYVCLVSIIVTYIQSIAQTRINLVELEVTTYPQVGILTTGPYSLHLGHVTIAAARHFPSIPLLVVEVGHCPGHCLYTTFYIRPLQLFNSSLVCLLVVVALGHIEEVEVVCTNPQLVAIFVLNGHFANPDGIVSFTAGKIEDKLHVLDSIQTLDFLIELCF